MRQAPPSPLRYSSPPRSSSFSSSSSISSPPFPSFSSPSSSAFSTSVQETSMEALNGKASCVNKNYYHDRFIRLFRPSYPPPPAMSPLINRGYFTRVRALELIVQAFEALVLASSSSSSSTCPTSDPTFLSPSPSTPSIPCVNLVLLGAGLDTFFLRLQDDEAKLKELRKETPETGTTAPVAPASIRRYYYEVDFAPVMQYKARCIRANEEVAAWLGVSEGGGGGGGGRGGGDSPGRRPTTTITRSMEPAVVLRSSSSIRARDEDEDCGSEKEEEKAGRTGREGGGGRYALLAGDLADTKALEKAFEEAGLDHSLPTLLIAECVLVYMGTEASRSLIKWTASMFPEAAWVSYDMILPHDAFGRMMRSNLKARGLTLPGFETWGRSLQTQMDRFVGTSRGEGGEGEEEKEGGREGLWERAVAGDMNAVYEYLLTAKDREKAAKLEHLDEVEEWQMLMGHYCYVAATQGAVLRSLLQGQPGFHEQARGGREGGSGKEAAEG